MFQARTDEGGIVVLTINDPRHRLNILTRAALMELNTIVEDLATRDPAPAGLVIISGKADNFVVGVDIKDFVTWETEQEASRGSSDLQSIFRKLAALPFPSVAAINGTCLGGGLELSLNCTSRIITDHPQTALGLPEVQLGLLPGGTGSQLLPRLVGVRAALDMMLTGRKVFGRKALRIGLADAIVSPPALLTAARQQILRPEAGLRKHRKPLLARLLDGPLKAIVFRAARKQVLAGTGGHFPAPLAILKLLRRTQGLKLDRGLQREAAAFGPLGVSPESRALVHVFLASNGGLPEVGAPPQEVSQLGILGAGLMGSGISMVALDKGLTVRHKDVSLEALGRAGKAIHHYIGQRVKKRIIQRQDAVAILGRYSPSTDYTGFGRAQAVVEAVFENLELKRQVIAGLEDVLNETAMIATNTSSLPISAIAEGARHPERIIGMHFFSPVEKMPLLEIITASATNEVTLATALALGKRLGKKIIVVKDSPGFYINRILSPYLSETFKLLADGVRVTELDRIVTGMGFPVGPCTLIDEVGIDVLGMVLGVMMPFVGERLQMQDMAGRFSADNRRGRKNGRGFYRYIDGQRKGEDPTVYELFDGPKQRKIPPAEVRQRLLYGILNEAAYALQEGIITGPAAGDTGAIYGFGYPPFMGGPFWTMDQIGLPALVESLQRLQEDHGSRFEPAPELLERAAAGRPYCH